MNFIEDRSRQVLRRAVRSGIALLMVGAASAFAQAPNCTQVQAPDCLYVPAATYSFATHDRTTSYTDITGAVRDVQVRIRVPAGAPEPLPVVIWSHGGAYGKDSPKKSLPEWGAVTATAGYLSVNIAHAARPGWDALCTALAIALGEPCLNFKHLNWDRPFDIRAVLDELERMNAAGEFAGRIDLTRIAVGGHSAGSGGALSVAGARRVFAPAPFDLADPRPVAFLAFSPQQPGSEGFFDTDFRRSAHSWQSLTRPVLTASGDGDSTCQPGIEPGSCIGDTPYGRRIGFQRMPGGGNKYQLHIGDSDAFHTLFELNLAACAGKGVGQAKCDEMGRWLTATAVAFLDGHVRQNAAALQWLQSDRVHNASHGVAEWLHR